MVKIQDPCEKYMSVWNFMVPPSGVLALTDEYREKESWFLANCIVDKLGCCEDPGDTPFDILDAGADTALSNIKTASLTDPFQFCGGFNKPFPEGSDLSQVERSKGSTLRAGAPVPSSFEFETSRDGGPWRPGAKGNLRRVIEGTLNTASSVDAADKIMPKLNKEEAKSHTGGITDFQCCGPAGAGAGAPVGTGSITDSWALPMKPGDNYNCPSPNEMADKHHPHICYICGLPMSSISTSDVGEEGGMENSCEHVLPVASLTQICHLSNLKQGYIDSIFPEGNDNVPVRAKKNYNRWRSLCYNGINTPYPGGKIRAMSAAYEELDPGIWGLDKDCGIINGNEDGTKSYSTGGIPCSDNGPHTAYSETEGGGPMGCVYKWAHSTCNEVKNNYPFLNIVYEDTGPRVHSINYTNITKTLSELIYGGLSNRGGKSGKGCDYDESNVFNPSCPILTGQEKGRGHGNATENVYDYVLAIFKDDPSAHAFPPGFVFDCEKLDSGREKKKRFENTMENTPELLRDAALYAKFLAQANIDDDGVAVQEYGASTPEDADRIIVGGVPFGFGAARYTRLGLMVAAGAIDGDSELLKAYLCAVNGIDGTDSTDIKLKLHYTRYISDRDTGAKLRKPTEDAKLLMSGCVSDFFMEHGDGPAHNPAKWSDNVRFRWENVFAVSTETHNRDPCEVISNYVSNSTIAGRYQRLLTATDRSEGPIRERYLAHTRMSPGDWNKAVHDARDVMDEHSQSVGIGSMPTGNDGGAALSYKERDQGGKGFQDMKCWAWLDFYKKHVLEGRQCPSSLWQSSIKTSAAAVYDSNDFHTNAPGINFTCCERWRDAYNAIKEVRDFDEPNKQKAELWIANRLQYIVHYIILPIANKLMAFSNLEELYQKGETLYMDQLSRCCAYLPITGWNREIKIRIEQPGEIRNFIPHIPGENLLKMGNGISHQLMAFIFLKAPFITMNTTIAPKWLIKYSLFASISTMARSLISAVGVNVFRGGVPLVADESADESAEESGGGQWGGLDPGTKRERAQTRSDLRPGPRRAPALRTGVQTARRGPGSLLGTDLKRERGEGERDDTSETGVAVGPPRRRRAAESSVDSMQTDLVPQRDIFAKILHTYEQGGLNINVRLDEALRIITFPEGFPSLEEVATSQLLLESDAQSSIYQLIVRLMDELQKCSTDSRAEQHVIQRIQKDLQYISEYNLLLLNVIDSHSTESNKEWLAAASAKDKSHLDLDPAGLDFMGFYDNINIHKYEGEGGVTPVLLIWNYYNNLTHRSSDKIGEIGNTLTEFQLRSLFSGGLDSFFQQGDGLLASHTDGSEEEGRVALQQAHAGYWDSARELRQPVLVQRVLERLIDFWSKNIVDLLIQNKTTPWTIHMEGFLRDSGVLDKVMGEEEEGRQARILRQFFQAHLLGDIHAARPDNPWMGLPNLIHDMINNITALYFQYNEETDDVSYTYQGMGMGLNVFFDVNDLIGMSSSQDPTGDIITKFRTRISGMEGVLEELLQILPPISSDRENLKELFDHIDAGGAGGGDGLISKKELVRYFHDNYSITEHHWQNVVSKDDALADLFAELRTKKVPAARLLIIGEIVGRVHGTIDKDGDGDITLLEFLTAMDPPTDHRQKILDDISSQAGFFRSQMLLKFPTEVGMIEEVIELFDEEALQNIFDGSLFKSITVEYGGVVEMVDSGAAPHPPPGAPPHPVEDAAAADAAAADAIVDVTGWEGIDDMTAGGRVQCQPCSTNKVYKPPKSSRKKSIKKKKTKKKYIKKSPKYSTKKSFKKGSRKKTLRKKTLRKKTLRKKSKRKSKK